MRKSVNSPKVFKPSGSYSQLLKVGDFVYISEQVGIDLDGNISDSLEKQVEVIFENTTSLLSELKMHINQVVKVSVYLKDSALINEFDVLYEKHFKHPYPARSIVIVDDLPEDKALVKMTFDAIDLSAYEIMNDCSEDGCSDCEHDDCEHH